MSVMKHWWTWPRLRLGTPERARSTRRSTTTRTGGWTGSTSTFNQVTIIEEVAAESFIKIIFQPFLVEFSNFYINAHKFLQYSEVLYQHLKHMTAFIIYEDTIITKQPFANRQVGVLKHFKYQCKLMSKYDKSTLILLVLLIVTLVLQWRTCSRCWRRGAAASCPSPSTNCTTRSTRGSDRSAHYLLVLQTINCTITETARLA